MNRKPLLKTAFAAVCACCATVASAVVQIEIEHDTSGCRPGYWTSDFAAAKAYADANHVPLLSFWGSADCAHCARMKSNGLMNDRFIKWVKEKPIVLVYTEVPGTMTRVVTNVKAFTQGDGTDGKKLTDYPFMRCYWNKADGTLVSRRFSGNSGEMPVTDGLISEQLVGTLNMYFGSWSPVPDYDGGYFSVTNKPNARLEAVAGKTTFVDIPMFRTEKAAAKNKLQINGGSLIDVSWAANELTKSYKYTVPTTAKAGTAIALRLFAEDGKTLKSTSAINVVAAKANAIGNPKWIGESFSAGEWTMDLDAALAKAKSATAKTYTLAVVGGDMWCPYCQGLRDGVLSKAEFVNWAKQNNVNLVCIDMPQKDKTTATLLTRDESTAGASGAAYLSRNMISDADAKKIFDRNKTLSGSTWLPKSSSATRLGNPTVLLLNSDKTVAARLYQANNGKVYPLAETLNRLNELLILAGGSDKDTDPAVTTKGLAIEATGKGELQVNRNALWYKLSNVPAGKVTFTASAADLELSVCEYSGSGACTNVLASGTKSVTVTFKTGSNKYLKVAGFMDNTKSYGTQTARSFTVTSAVTLSPSETVASFTTKSGTVNLAVTAGKVYKLSGFSDYSAFTKNADGTYTAKSSGTIAMKAPAGGTVTFQLWQPGTVQFTTTSAKIMEADGKTTVKVSRTGGASDAASFKITADKGSNGSARVSASPATVSWAAGDSSTKTVTLAVKANAAFNPDELFTVTLAKASGSASLGSAKTFKLTVTDTDDPVLPSASYAKRYYKGTQVSESFPVSNIKGSGDMVSLNVSGKLPSGLRFSFDAGSKAVVLSGKPSRATEATVSVTVSERRNGQIASGAPSTFKVTVVDATALKPGDKGYNKVVVAGGTSYATVPVYGTYKGAKVVAGSVLLTMTKTLRLSAKFTGTAGAKVSLSGGIGSIADNGTVTAVLSRGNAKATVSLAAGGRASVTLSGISTEFGSSLSSDSVGANMAHGALDAYAGYYTVTLPADTTKLTKGGEEVPTGTGYVILKMNLKTFTRTGKVTYAGMLPSGKTISGTAYLSADHVTEGGATWAYLPIVVSKSSGAESIGFVLRLRKNAANTYKNDPMVVLAAEDGAVPFWSYGGIETALNVYGGYYDQGMNLSDCCSEFYDSTSFKLGADTTWFADSTVYGKLSGLPVATVTVDSSSKMKVLTADGSLPVKLSLAKKTGVVTGSYSVSFSGGRTVRLTVKGVLLPGWTDCGCTEESSAIVRPLFSGIGYYSDRIGGGKAKRGFAIEFK